MVRRRFEQALITALGLLVVLAAALLGGVYPAQQVGLSAAALGLFALALIFRLSKRGDLTLGAPFWVLALVAGVVLLQVAELPQAVLAWLQPRGTALAAYATEGLGPPLRRCLSLDPPATALSVALLVGLAALGGTAALLVRDGSRALLLLWTVNFGGMALALVAAVQRLSGAKAVFWVYEPVVGKEFVTPFVNPNHAGGFYGALTFLSLGLALQMRERRPRLLGAALAALPGFMVIASASRGAIVATCAGAFLFLVLRWRSGELGRRQLAYWLAGVLLVGTVALPFSSTVRREFGAGTQWEALDEDAKLLIWKDAFGLVKDYPLTGVGRGAFRTAFPAYQDATEGTQRTFSHPENLFLQWIVELGPFLAFLLLVGIGALGFRYLRKTRLTPMHAVALCPVAVLVLQNTVDFNLEFPGTAFLAVCLVGVLAGLRLGRTGRVAPRWQRRSRAALLIGLCVAGAAGVWRLGAWGVRQDLTAETRALQARLEGGSPPEGVLADLRQAIRRHPADYYLQYLAGAASLKITGEQPLRHFNRALYLNPRSSLTQFQVGRALQQLGLYDQALGHYLEALRLRMPLSGTFARDLFRLLQQIWAKGATARQLRRLTACEPAPLQPGRLPVIDCLLVEELNEVEQSRPLARVAAIDPLAARQLALWLEQVKLLPQALSAWSVLHAARSEEVEPLESLTRLSLEAKDVGRALHWAREWAEHTRLAEAYVSLAEIQRDAGSTAAAEATVDAARKRYPDAPGLIAVKAEILVLRGESAAARDLLITRLVGAAMDVKDEIRLLKVRVALETKLGNKMRAERLKSRLGELERMVQAGYRGTSLRP